MIIDKILDRYDGEAYNARMFYCDMLDYGNSEISSAMDYGTEDDVRIALCNYIDKNQYNTKIKKFINQVEWLKDDKSTNWENIIDIS